MSGDSSDIWPGLGVLLYIGSDDNSPKSPMTLVLIANVPRRFNPECFLKNMIDLSIVGRWIKLFAYTAICLEIALKDRVEMMHL
jgi:hypothetical protein